MTESNKIVPDGRIPTVELHRHFEAGLRPETIALLAQHHRLTEVRTRTGQKIPGIDPQDPNSIRNYYRGIAQGFGRSDGFTCFADSFGLPLSVLRNLDDLAEAAYAQILDTAAAGSLHTELRGSPFTYQEMIHEPLEAIAQALLHGIDRAWQEKRASGTFLLTFSRQKGLSTDPLAPLPQRQASIIALLAAKLHRSDRPVGLDIAGYPELTYPPRMFVEALRPALEAGVPISVHAGEQGRPPAFTQAPPELILEAVELLQVQRIGHGTALAASASARSLIRERGIGIECCPWSNHCMGFISIEEHPLPLLLKEGLLVSLSTDDPLMFGPFTVAETFARIARPLGLDASALLQMTRHGIATAFVTAARRDELLDQLETDSLG